MDWNLVIIRIRVKVPHNLVVEQVAQAIMVHKQELLGH